MRILWLSMTPGLLHEGEGTGNYGGSGWIGALQHLFMDANTGDQLALSFVSNAETTKIQKDGIFYYPIFEKPERGINKLYRYYYGYRYDNDEKYVPQMLSVIKDFRPDIIHLFGIESPLASILGNTRVPVVVHLQGILGPCNNAFYPSGMNKTLFHWPPTKREWLLRNGFLYEKKLLEIRAQKETKRFKKALYFMGRTEWDCHVSHLLSPSSKYFKVNEALRPTFYKHKGEWTRKPGKFVITSTISETIYKGLDLVLKTAKLLIEESNIDFEWRIIGINENCNMVKFFERYTRIKAEEVNVKYMGVMQASTMVDSLLDASVYVHPSYIDNSPNSVCEAQILGLPVIAVNVGGVSSLVEHKITGILVPANAPYELAYWINKMHKDTSFVHTICNNGISCSCARHRADLIIPTLLNAYNQIIENNDNNFR